MISEALSVGALQVAQESVEQRRGLLSERPLAGGPSRSHEGPSEEDPALLISQRP